jgi:hypothetical protein
LREAKKDMVKTPVLYKSLVVGVIVLFIGVGVQPAFALNESASISDDEDDCNLCPKVSKQHIVRIKDLIDRLDTLNTKLSKVSKLNPEIEENYQEISDRISTLTEMKEKYLSNDEWDFPFIRLTLCFILVPFWGVAFMISMSLAFFLWICQDYILIWNIVRTILWIPFFTVEYILWEIDSIMEDLRCYSFPPE